MHWVLKSVNTLEKYFVEPHLPTLGSWIWTLCYHTPISGPSCCVSMNSLIPRLLLLSWVPLLSSRWHWPDSKTRVANNFISVVLTEYPFPKEHPSATFGSILMVTHDLNKCPPISLLILPMIHFANPIDHIVNLINNNVKVYSILYQVLEELFWAMY